MTQGPLGEGGEGIDDTVLTQQIPFVPAQKNAAAIFAAIPASPGVFLLRGHESSAEPYAAKTANLRRRISRLLGPPEEAGISKRLNLRERCAAIEFTATGSDLESSVLLYRLLREVFPSTYAKRLRLETGAPLIRIHWENAYPRAYVTRKLGALNKKSVYYGPFRSRVLAEKFLNDVLDLFKSRRCTFELHPDPVFPGCVYSEMKMCLAPCFKGCTDAEYMAETLRVQDFLDTCGQSGCGKTMLDALSTERDRASTALEFEAAAAAHTKTEKVKEVVRGSDEIIGRLDRLDAITIQHSSLPDHVALFRFAQGQIVGPAQLLTLGMLPANERSGDTSLFAQPLMAQPVVERSGEGAAAFAASRPQIEARLEEALSALTPRDRVPANLFSENLALWKRWYYRSSRKGEVFFRNESGEWPWRRILNGVSRTLMPPVAPPSAISPAAAMDSPEVNASSDAAGRKSMHRGE